MGQIKTIFEVGNYYHIYNRGCNKENIFWEHDNYIFLLNNINKYSEAFSITVIAYCLMPNHYHLLVRQDSNHPISTFIQRVFNSYTKAINKKYKRSGTLFEGKFHSIQIDIENYLIHLCRYIHRNPIKAKLVDSVGKWENSNYHEWIGIRNGKLFDKNFILERFGSISNYIDFVEDDKNYVIHVNFENVKLD